MHPCIQPAVFFPLSVLFPFRPHSCPSLCPVESWSSILFPRTLCRHVEISAWIRALQNCDHRHLNNYEDNVLNFIWVCNPEYISAGTKSKSLVRYKPDLEQTECLFSAMLSVFFIFTGFNLSLCMIQFLFHLVLLCWVQTVPDCQFYKWIPNEYKTVPTLPCEFDGLAV